MLIGFLINDEQDWADWKSRINSATYRPIIHIHDGDLLPDYTQGRREALEEVEALDDFEDSDTSV